MKATWFKFETSLKDDIKMSRAIIKHGPAAIGVYATILSILTEAENEPVFVKDLEFLCKKYSINKKLLHSILFDFSLFEIENFDQKNQRIRCFWLEESLDKQRAKALILRENGAKGGRPTNNQMDNQMVLQMDNQMVNQNETKSITKTEPNRIELNRIEENRRENTLTSIEEKKEKEKKELVASGKPKAKLKKEVLEGFYIEEKREGQPHLRQIATYDDPAIIEWLGKNWEASFSIQQAWLNNNKSAVWRLWQTFFETNKMLYRDTWAGLHSHFCRYLKKASQKEFEAKPQKPIKPPVESNRPEEPRRRQTPEEREAAIKAVRDQLIREEEEERAKRAAKLAQEQQLKDEVNKILPNG